MAGFQATVNVNQGFGLVGEFYDNTPKIVDAYTLRSTPEINTVGNAFTIESEGVAATGAAGSTGIFAGILVDPKQYTNTNGDLSATLDVAEESIGDICKRGRIVVNLGETAVIGTAVKYNDTTGVLGAGAPAAGETAVPNAEVVLFDIGANGVGVIELLN